MATMTTKIQISAHGDETEPVFVPIAEALADLEAQPLDGRVCTSSPSWSAGEQTWSKTATIEHPAGSSTAYCFYGADCRAAELAGF